MKFFPAGPGGGLVPVERFEIIAHELLVKADRTAADTVLIRRPETARIGREHLIDQNHLPVDFAELEFGIGDNDPPFFRIIARRGVDLEREITRRQHCAEKYCPHHPEGAECHHPKHQG
mgnify:CR=1 FL=1